MWDENGILSFLSVSTHLVAEDPPKGQDRSDPLKVYALYTGDFCY